VVYDSREEEDGDACLLSGKDFEREKNDGLAQKRMT
jgi:hypothetical protein